MSQANVRKQQTNRKPKQKIFGLLRLNVLSRAYYRWEKKNNSGNMAGKSLIPKLVSIRVSGGDLESSAIADYPD